MGLLGDIGIEGSMPKIDLTGMISNSWIYVFLAAILGAVLIAIAVAFFYTLTYNRKVVLFENISGQGYQPIMKTRARIIRLGSGGEELLKTMKGGYFVSAYGRKMGKNTYWYAKAQDGYWYNFILADLDAKRGMLDIEPIDRDVRMFHVALDRMSQMTYGKTNLFEKYAVHMILFVFLVVLILGMWFIVGKIGEAVAPLSDAASRSLEIQEVNSQITERLENIVSGWGGSPAPTSKGLEPAS